MAGIIAALVLRAALAPSLVQASDVPVQAAEVEDASSETTAIIFAGIRSTEKHADVASVLEARIATRLEARGQVEVVRNWDLGRVIDVHADRIIAGCHEDCDESVDILGALGAPLLLVGQIHALGGVFDLSLTLIETETGRVRGRAVGEARTERRLVSTAEDLAWSLLRQADLARPGLGPSGLESPRFHLAIKAGNSLASVGSDLVAGRLHGGRLNIEANYYVNEVVLLFLEIGATLGRVRDSDHGGILDLTIVPAGIGVKRLWTFERWRLWAGGALGAGVFGLFLGQAADVTAAFSTTLVVGADWRLSSRWTLLVEGSTSLTDAIFDRAREQDLSVPLLGGLTVGVAWMIP